METSKNKLSSTKKINMREMSNMVESLKEFYLDTRVSGTTKEGIHYNLTQNNSKKKRTLTSYAPSKRNTKVYKANGARYLTDINYTNTKTKEIVYPFQDGLPHGIFNKAVTDAGGTFTSIIAPRHTVIAAPLTPIIDSILDDKELSRRGVDVFGVHSKLGVTYSQFKEYVKDIQNKGGYINIACTYDSLPKVISWVGNLNAEGVCTLKITEDFSLVVDEFDNLLTEFGYRDSAITNLLKVSNTFSRFTFMSATPLESIFIPKSLQKLPYTVIDWGTKKVNEIVSIPTNDVYAKTLNVINKFRSPKGLVIEDINGEHTKVEHLFIFLNSVKGIKSLVTAAELSKDDCRVICADGKINQETLSYQPTDRKSVQNIPVSSVEPYNHKPITFLTKKAFSGCNIFCKNGLVLVISDGSKEHTLVDIGGQLHQISGRLRYNKQYQNKFRHILWHVHSKAHSIVPMKEYIEKTVTERLKDTNTTIKIYNEQDDEGKALLKKGFEWVEKAEGQHYMLYDDSGENDRFIFSREKLQHDVWRHNLRLTYSKGFYLHDAYSNYGFDDVSDISYEEFFNSPDKLYAKKGELELEISSLEAQLNKCRVKTSRKAKKLVGEIEWLKRRLSSMTSTEYAHLQFNDNFSTLLQGYIAVRKHEDGSKIKSNSNTKLISEYENSYPIFREAYKILGESKIKQLSYCEKAIRRATYSLEDNTVLKAAKTVIEGLKGKEFFSNKDYKKLLKDFCKVFKTDYGTMPKDATLFEGTGYKLKSTRNTIDGVRASRCFFEKEA